VAYRLSSVCGKKTFPSWGGKKKTSSADVGIGGFTPVGISLEHNTRDEMAMGRGHRDRLRRGRETARSKRFQGVEGRRG